MKRSRTLLAVLLLIGCAIFFYRNPVRLGHGTVVPGQGGASESKEFHGPAPLAHQNASPVQEQDVAPVPAPASGHHDGQPGSSAVPAPARRSIPITADFVRQLVNGPDSISVPLPDGRIASGFIQFRDRTPQGQELGVTGRITSPGNGSFNFYLEEAGSVKGPVVGAVILENEPLAFSALAGPDWSSRLTELPVDLVICRSYAAPPEEADAPEEALPSEYPTTVAIPPYQNGVIPLQSNPSATKVIYLDYDGEKGPFAGWGSSGGTGYFDAASPNASNSQIKDVWTRVCEDYAGFNVNITTDLQVYLNAATNSKQRIIVTPTTDAAPGAGGVAYVGSFGETSQRVCWSFYSTGKNAAEVIAHEVGHTLGLQHDGRTTPAEGYYLGHGTDPVGWAPIMGAGYYKNLSQWSKGEYLSANNSQDDIAVITAILGTRADDTPATHATAIPLEIFGSGTVDTEGSIETRSDVDAFKFTTTGGAISLTIADASASPNLDLSASIYDSTDTLVLTNNPDTAVTTTLSTTLAAGEYTVRVDGVGRGDALVDGYTDYGSIGQYTISGTITGAVVPDRVTIAENIASGATVGTPTLRNSHPGATLTYSIASGNTGSAFAIDPSTGVITVATPSALNYETLSANWQDPAALELTISVVDSVNSALNETLRFIVSVTDVNESPTLNGPSSIAVISHTLTGTALGTYNGTDPDHYDQCTYSIVSGNSSGKFAINSSTGVLTANGDLDSTVLSSYNLAIRATDKGAPGLTSDQSVAISIVPCSTAYTPGYVNRTLYEGITGSTISNLTSNAAYPASPTREIRLSEFTDNTRGDNYGSTVRTWMIAPYTGTYQFWISGDNVAELYINTAGATSPLTSAGSVTTATAYQNFSASGSQTNGTYSLTAGQVCYLEARQKESTSSDHLSVAWQIKDASNVNTIVAQQVIPGRYLSPHYMSYTATNAVAATSGLIEEFWDGISGTSLSTLTSLPAFPNKPDRLTDLLAFNTVSSSSSDNYGARIRAYVIPPTTAAYTFYISGDDATSLLLSTDSTPANAVQIASTTSASGYQTWTTYGTQTSTAINLTAGQKYYIEARVKEATGGDHLSVAWSGGTTIGTTATIIADAYTQPYDSNVAPSFGSASYSFSLPTNYALNTLAGMVTATDATFEDLRYAIVSGDSRNAFAINPATGAISVGNLSTLSIGSTYNLQVGARDSGHGGHFTPKETLVPVTIVVPGTNVAPQFTATPIALGSFPAGQAISASIAAYVTDPGDAIAFSLVSGPSWLSISSAGVISGTPGYTEFGLHTITVAANDGNGHTVNGTVTLTISAPANVPVATLVASNASTTQTTGTVTGGTTTTNASTSDNSYHTLREASSSGTSALDYRWTFTTTPNRPATLRVEAHHTSNTEGDDFQFSVSTNGGTSFTNAILVTKTADDNTAQTFSFTAGSSGSTIIKVIDTNRTSGRTSLDTLSVDLLALDQGANNVPVLSNATLQVAAHAPIGATLGTVSATESDAGQSLTYSIPRGNEAGLFSISSTGAIKVAADISTLPATYPLIVVATDNGVPSLANYATITVNLVEAIPATLTLGNLTPTYNGAPQAVTATTNPGGLGVAITYNGSATLPTSAGSYAISATIVDPVYTGSATATQVISKASASITFGNLNPTFDGSAKSVTATTTPTGLTVGITYNGSASAPSTAGSYAVVGTISDTNYQGSNSATLVIAKASATVALGSLSQTYSGSGKSATATTLPAGLSVTFTYNGSSTPPTNAGSYAVVGTINSINYAGSSSGTLVIGKATATLTLGSLSQTYSGTGKSVTSVTSPPGLTVGYTYDGSATAPINAGSYAVSATINDTNYLGNATGTLVIGKATAGITLSGLSATYDGSQKPVSATTTPGGLTVGFTYDASSTAPTNAGTYAIVATVNDSNYLGSASGSLVIAKASATVTLGDLATSYDGSPKSVSASTSPGGLNVVVTYDGSPTPPIAAGSYAAVATVSDTNYSGTSSGTLVIAPASASVTLGNLSQTFDGSSKPVSVSTSPAALSTSITYNGSSTPPTHAGTYSVVATITDPNYSGSTSGSLVIDKAAATVNLSGLSQTYDGSSKSASASTSPSGLNLAITYNGSPTLPVAAGTYAVAATVNDADYQGSASGTLVIGKASATVTLGDLSATYDGNPNSITATTTPPGLNVQFTYEGTVPPTDAGTYAVSATIDDPNYLGSASGSLVVAKATASVELSGLLQAYDGSPKSVTATTTPSGLGLAISYDGSPTPPSAAGSYAIVATVVDANHSGSASGTLVISNGLVVAASESLALPNATTTYASLLNDGTVTFGAGTVTISGNATNHGVLRLTGDAVLNVSGTFTNTGVIDVINWSGTLPPGLINSGTILDRSAIRVTSTQAGATSFSLTVPGYAGHVYQLQSTSNLGGGWTNSGTAQTGTGSATNPPALQFEEPVPYSPATAPRRFYRIVVTPAP